MGLRWIGAVMAMVMILSVAAAQEKRLEFDVASVKENRSDDKPHTNFPIGPGDMYGSVGGRFAGKNMPLSAYIMFAYKMDDYQTKVMAEQLPAWAKTERYDIEAKVEGQPAKDEMRAMMRSLLEERFALKVHHEMKEVPVFALVALKPGETGSGLMAHPVDVPCGRKDSRGDVQMEGPKQGEVWPAICGGMALERKDGVLRVGARDVPMKLIAAQMPQMGGLTKPVVDETGLEGNFDFSILYSPDQPLRASVDAAPAAQEQVGPSFQKALKEQLGLRLEAKKAGMDTVVLDHVERPSAN